MKAFFAQRNIYSDRISLGIGERDYKGALVIVHGLTREVHETGQPSEPTMELTHEEARALMDELWAAGVRPSNGEGNAGQLGATEKHLEDMRRLVFESDRLLSMR